MGLAGAVTFKPPDAEENARRLNRWPMLFVWVTFARRSQVTFATPGASGVPTKNVCP